jgi:hypothetical protein
MGRQNGSDFRAFLNEPMRPAQVSAVSQSGLPVLGSLWFLFEDGRFWFNSLSGTPLLKAASDGTAVAVLVDDFDPPGRIMQVRVRGEGSIESPDSERVARIYGRYLGEPVASWPLSFPGRLTDPAWTLWSVLPRSGMAVDSTGFLDQQEVRWNELGDCPL